MIEKLALIALITRLDCIFFLEKKFLTFFFKRLKINDSNRYANDFPYLSLCGKEINYVRCDNLPIVFTHIIQNKNGSDCLSYGYAEDSLMVRTFFFIASDNVFFCILFKRIL